MRASRRFSRSASRSSPVAESRADVHPETRGCAAALVARELCPRRRCRHRREVAPPGREAEVADSLGDAVVRRQPRLRGLLVGSRGPKVVELLHRRLVQGQRLLDIGDDVRIRAWTRAGRRRVGIRRADRVGLLDEVAVREPAVAAAGRQCQRCSEASTSSRSGKRRASCFEKTSSPSRSTSNWLLSPGVTDVSKPSRVNSAARLAARSSYPFQTGQYRISTLMRGAYTGYDRIQ